MPISKKDDVPTVGTPKRRGRASVNPAAVASPVRATRRTVPALADDVPTVGTPKRRGRASVNPAPAAVASPVRVTRRTVPALAEEVRAVSSPKRKSRASINPSVTASPARGTRYRPAVPAAEEELETQAARSPTKSRRKSTLPKGKSEAQDEAELQKEKSASITKIEESPESRASSAETSRQVDTDTKPSQLPAADRTPENISTRTSRNTPSGSADDKTPETKIPIRSNRNTPPGSGNGEFRTPTRSQGGSRPSTPVSRNSPRNISDPKTSVKPSPDRHANCNSRGSSPIYTSRDLRRNYFSSPVRHSPRSSPSRKPLLSFGESRDAIPKPSYKTKPTSPLVSGKSGSPSQLNRDHSPRSSPRVRNAAKGKKTSVSEKHCLDADDVSLVMSNKRIKRDTADGEAGPSSNAKPLQGQHFPKQEQKEKVSDDSPRLELNEENTEHTSIVGDPVGVDGADSDYNEKETRSNASLSIPGIRKLSVAETSNVKVDEKVDLLENTAVSDEASVREQTPPAKPASADSPVRENSPDASRGKAHNIKESLVVSSVKSESEKGRISDLGEAVVNAKDDRSYAPNMETPTIRESLEVSPSKSYASLDSAFEKSTVEHIPRTDSEYHSSVVRPSDKDVKVPSIVEGLEINHMKHDISVTVNLASQADSGKVTSSSDRTLNTIIENDEDVSGKSSVPKSKDDTRESKLSVSDNIGDQLVSSSETNAVATTIDEHKNTDQPSFAYPLGLAVSPEASGSVEDDSTSKDEMGSSAMKYPSKDVESLSVEDSGEKIDTTTVLGKLGLKKHAVTSETKAVSEDEKIERAPIEQDECGPEVYENDRASVGDSDEDAGDVNCPMKGSDFIDNEAEEDEETDEESENNESMVYDATEESDSADSDVELLDQSCFIIDEAKEAKSFKKKPSSDSVVSSGPFSDNGAEDGPETEDVERSGKVVDFDESCYIIKNSDEGEDPRELKTEDIPENGAQESEMSPKADEPVFKVTELLGADGTTVDKTQEFASGAASDFVTRRKKSVMMGQPMQSILKSFKVLETGNAYASTTASQFVISEIASEERQEKDQPKVDKRNGASTQPPQKSDSSFSSSDQEQENTERIPKAKKRPTTEAEVLKQNKYKMETNAPGFCVKLCNIAPRTSIDQLKKALEEFGIVTGLQSLGFCPKTDKHKKTAIVTYDSKKNLQRALANYGKVTVNDRRIFFLLDDETAPISDDQPQADSLKKSPRKKFVGIIGDLPQDITIGDIIGAYEQEGIKFLIKVKIYKLRSSKDNVNLAKLEFSKKTALLKAIIVTEKIRIKGNKITLKIRGKRSIS